MVDWSQRTREIAPRYSIDVERFWRQIRQESGFNPDAYNASSGATGIAQIVPRWHPGVNARDPEASLNYAANWMRQMIQSYRSKPEPWAWALVGYNAGPGVASTWDGDRSKLPRETREYLAAVLGPGDGDSTPPVNPFPDEKPSWWPDGLPWPPFTIPTPQLPSLPTADDLASLVWETFDGLRQKARDAIVANAKDLAATFGGPVAFWIVGSSLVIFGLIGLALAGASVMFRSQGGRAVRGVAGMVAPTPVKAGIAAAGTIL